MVCRTWLLLFLGIMTWCWLRCVECVNWPLNTRGAAIVALVTLTCLSNVEALTIDLKMFSVVVTCWPLLQWTRGARPVTRPVALNALSSDSSNGAIVELSLCVNDRTCGLGLILLAIIMLSTSGTPLSKCVAIVVSRTLD